MMRLNTDRAMLAASLVHMIKLAEAREITPYAWVHPDDDR
jgi:hypothetical protein